ncbi:MAG: hypothetical protein HOV86_07510 [Thermoactinospora sp.]|nr:hypothetical protein [Thermoactinospora sp.]
MRRHSKDTCALVLHGLGGVAASDRDYPCSTVPYRGTAAGLIGAGGLFAPDGRSILSRMSVHDAAGRWALVTRGEKLFRVELHPGGGKPGSIVELAPPPAPDGQLGWVSLSPDGRTAAVALVEPAWPGPRQSFDLWLLDLESAAWSRAPGMPVPAAVKTIAHRWTATGDLVLAGRFPTTGAVHPAEYSGAVVTVRPGLPYLMVERVDLPDGHTVSVM